MSFSRRANPIWLFVDLTGNILDDTYYISFLQNTIPYMPQAVYQSSIANGTDPWANPLQFYPNGTLPDNLYFTDGVVYRLEIRQGDASAPSNSDPLIYLIENFVDEESIIPPVNTGVTSDNQITNPQFAFVLFNNTATLVNTTTTTYTIAPGWYLDISGSCTITLTQVPIAGINNISTNGQTNPGYSLEVTVSSGTPTVLNLRQRFSNMGALWSGQQVSLTYTAKTNGGFQTLNVYYKPSTTTDVPNEYLLSSEQISPVYQEFFGGTSPDAPINPSTNTDVGAAAFVDLIFSLPLTGSIFLTNIQIIGSAGGGPLAYEQTTYERQLDQTYHYYANSILTEPKDNILVGWVFPLNPWQFRTPTITNLATNAYTADQTIIVQQAYVNNIANTNNIAVGRAGFANNYNFVVQAVTATNRFAMIQYIDPSTARPYWGKLLSAMVRASINTSHGTLCNFKVRLIYRSSLPSTISQTEPIASWSATDNSEPVLAAGWTAINPLNDPIYTFANNSVGFAFDQFQLPVSANDNMVLGIMLFTLTSTNQNATADQLLFDRISLTLNDFAIDASVETFDDNLRKCQFYYEKSYRLSVIPGAAAAGDFLGAINLSWPIVPDTGAGNTTAYIKRIFLPYKQTKSTTSPTITFYSGTPTAANISVGVNDENGAIITALLDCAMVNYTLIEISSDNVLYSPNGTDSSYSLTAGLHSNYEGIAIFHYTIDARLGR